MIPQSEPPQPFINLTISLTGPSKSNQSRTRASQTKNRIKRNTIEIGRALTELHLSQFELFRGFGSTGEHCHQCKRA